MVREGGGARTNLAGLGCLLVVLSLLTLWQQARQIYSATNPFELIPYTLSSTLVVGTPADPAYRSSGPAQPPHVNKTRITRREQAACSSAPEDVAVICAIPRLGPSSGMLNHFAHAAQFLLPCWSTFMLHEREFGVPGHSTHRRKRFILLEEASLSLGDVSGDASWTGSLLRHFGCTIIAGASTTATELANSAQTRGCTSVSYRLLAVVSGFPGVRRFTIRSDPMLPIIPTLQHHCLEPRE